MEEEEVSRLGVEEQYNSLAEEIEGKTRKLKKLFGKFKAAQAEIKDLQDEFAREKEVRARTPSRRRPPSPSRSFPLPPAVSLPPFPSRRVLLPPTVPLPLVPPPTRPCPPGGVARRCLV